MILKMISMMVTAASWAQSAQPFSKLEAAWRCDAACIVVDFPANRFQHLSLPATVLLAGSFQSWQAHDYRTQLCQNAAQAFLQETSSVFLVQNQWFTVRQRYGNNGYYSFRQGEFDLSLVLSTPETTCAKVYVADDFHTTNHLIPYEGFQDVRH